MKKFILLSLFFSVLSLNGFSQVKKANPVYNKTDFRDSTYFEKGPVFNHLSQDSINGNILGVKSNGQIIKGGMYNTQKIVYKTQPQQYAVFGTGSGLVADSSVFQNGMIAGSFYNLSTDTLICVSINSGIIHGVGLDTARLIIYAKDTLFSLYPKTIGTVIIGRVSGVNSALYGKNIVTSFTNSKIPPGYWVWGKLFLPSYTRKPQFLSSTLSVYKK